MTTLPEENGNNLWNGLKSEKLSCSLSPPFNHWMNSWQIVSLNEISCKGNDLKVSCCFQILPSSAEDDNKVLLCHLYESSSLLAQLGAFVYKDVEKLLANEGTFSRFYKLRRTIYLLGYCCIIFWEIDLSQLVYATFETKAVENFE